MTDFLRPANQPSTGESFLERAVFFTYPQRRDQLSERETEGRGEGSRSLWGNWVSLFFGGWSRAVVEGGWVLPKRRERVVSRAGGGLPRQQGILGSGVLGVVRVEEGGKAELLLLFLSSHGEPLPFVVWVSPLQAGSSSSRHTGHGGNGNQIHNKNRAFVCKRSVRGGGVRRRSRSEITLFGWSHVCLLSELPVLGKMGLHLDHFKDLPSGHNHHPPKKKDPTLSLPTAFLTFESIQRITHSVSPSPPTTPSHANTNNSAIPSLKLKPAQPLSPPTLAPQSAPTAAFVGETPAEQQGEGDAGSMLTREERRAAKAKAKEERAKAKAARRLAEAAAATSTSKSASLSSRSSSLPVLSSRSSRVSKSKSKKSKSGGLIRTIVRAQKPAEAPTPVSAPSTPPPAPQIQAHVGRASAPAELEKAVLAAFAPNQQKTRKNKIEALHHLQARRKELIDHLQRKIRTLHKSKKTRSRSKSTRRRLREQKSKLVRCKLALTSVVDSEQCSRASTPPPPENCQNDDAVAPCPPAASSSCSCDATDSDSEFSADEDGGDFDVEFADELDSGEEEEEVDDEESAQ
ncbi:hypothetical protein BDK51DRAFT_25641 [Blyttiomyces helicus]|uniref:Uncharacterized protein n=1 Tax=Blyttiomyces helicus TaxID=388810 RepID=A0A4P9WLY2_9FUNG|nr:hypothetical protein BDK51DRAFT_25641 [Blyttiomyces helicus]|eukprot:RKO94059.1 hypothetical protein BDK51DRAFT_25641 [Blyttiomyces helicus]